MFDKYHKEIYEKQGSSSSTLATSSTSVSSSASLEEMAKNLFSAKYYLFATERMPNRGFPIKSLLAGELDGSYRDSGLFKLELRGGDTSFEDLYHDACQFIRGAGTGRLYIIAIGCTKEEAEERRKNGAFSTVISAVIDAQQFANNKRCITAEIVIKNKRFQPIAENTSSLNVSSSS